MKNLINKTVKNLQWGGQQFKPGAKQNRPKIYVDLPLFQ